MCSRLLQGPKKSDSKKKHPETDEWKQEHLQDSSCCLFTTDVQCNWNKGHGQLQDKGATIQEELGNPKTAFQPSSLSRQKDPSARGAGDEEQKAVSLPFHMHRTCPPKGLCLCRGGSTRLSPQECAGPWQLQTSIFCSNLPTYPLFLMDIKKGLPCRVPML